MTLNYSKWPFYVQFCFSLAGMSRTIVLWFYQTTVMHVELRKNYMVHVLPLILSK